MTQQEWINQINERQVEVNTLIDEYWALYSSPSSWQFWYHIVLLVVPLLLLYRFINRERFFEILFYGYTTHVLVTYLDSLMSRYGYWEHPYMILSQYPFTLSINASLLPVTYILLYQYCTDRKKSFHLWLLPVTAIMAFGFVEIHEQMNIFQIYDKINVFQLHGGLLNFYMFLLNYVIASLAFWITKLFIKIKYRT
ncbi:hypothetical protein N0O92_09475 [Alkalihalobacillus sp. MEB130]|uniref:CBO0543 family protein n=1 Tax=Alkalihalobacillus sp. MEB130 TaxID=2976704 RepID=UPI0028DE3357|nr:CBO0543 family protein [Alkalihalobacillus sp. MEB130]MDT8860465.1 hypothetical protein [Alkalihalobacillus sp. MEB130]